MKKNYSPKQNYKIGIYVRVSTEEQAENPEGSIRSQECRLREYVKHKNSFESFGEIVEFYCDAGISAKDTNRPAFQRMMDDARSNKINMILITELSRLTRSIRDFANLVAMLDDLDCQIYSLKDQFDSSTAVGSFSMFLMANLAQFERKQIGCSKVTEETYQWLYLTVWLGLRPEEADSVVDKKAVKVTFDDVNNVNVISIYQSKLMSISEELRWKHIPVIFKEQNKCLEIIEKKNIHRPHPKTIRKYSGSDRITCYGGRKNFVDLCLDRNQEVNDISMWLGHKNSNITMAVYKQRQVVRFNPVQKKQKGFKIV